MFHEVSLTRHITENYSLFTTETLLNEKPVQNWPLLFGQKCADVINKHLQVSTPLKVLIAHGGTGRVTLEVLRNCRNLVIDHTDMTANTLQVLERLLGDGKLQWYQQVEGTLAKHLQYCLSGGETIASLLEERNNSVNYYQADYKNMRPQLADYDVIIADFRHKNSAEEVKEMSSRLKKGGLLLLASIDDVDAGLYADKKHSLVVLKQEFERVDAQAQMHAHIYCETRNKHQYAISYFSQWRKKESDEVQGVIDGKATSLHLMTTDEYYEDKGVLTSYNLFHFGEGLLGVKNFPLRMAEVCIEMCQKYGVDMSAALDAGCGPGRTAMELCLAFKQVEAYDYGHSFVEMMIQEADKREIGNLTAYQGDSHKQEVICRLEKFDMILGCNLIDRLHTPRDWVNMSKNMLTDKGLLIISSPYTWQPEHTDPAKYIGGYMRDGEEQTTAAGLQELLQPELSLLEVLRVPFVIPDPDGTYQYTYSNCTVFGRPR